MDIRAIVRWVIVFVSICIGTMGIYRYSLMTTVTSCLVYPILQLNRLCIEPFKTMNGSLVHNKNFDALKRENQLLHLQNIRLRAALSYVQNIKELHVFNQRYQEKGCIAQVVARYFSRESHYFLLDAGSQKGIIKDMVVLYKNNLIGKVTDVYPWYSKACLITDRHCKVAAYCSCTKAHGVYEGVNEEGRAILNFVDHLSEVRQNDIIFSSGEGLIFPEGFALGRISTCSNDGLYKKIAIEPLCNMREVDYCLIVAKQ